jgi:HlyD family secretion protein
MRLGTLATPKRLRSYGTWLVVALVLAFVLYRAKFAPVSVVTHSVANGPIVAEVMGTGTLEPRVKTTISPRIQERLAEVLVDQNDPVAAGQLLAVLDDGELTRQVDVATASLTAARATLDRVKTDEARALAVEEQARLAHRRASELLATGILSGSDFDKAMEQLHVAEADVRRSRAAIGEAERQVITAQKNLAFQEERLGFTRIVSPYDGLIVRRDRDPGGVVVPGGSILQLISTDEIWVSAWVDETSIAGLAVGQPARVLFRSDASAANRGEVARIGRETDRETREFLVDVRVSDLPANWTVGQRAEVYIETARKDSTIVLPSRFVSWRAGRPGAFVVVSGEAKWRGLKLGLRGLEAIEISDGLSAGDVVCIPREASRPLRDGQRVTAVEAAL